MEAGEEVTVWFGCLAGGGWGRAPGRGRGTWRQPGGSRGFSASLSSDRRHQRVPAGRPAEPARQRREDPRRRFHQMAVEEDWAVRS